MKPNQQVGNQSCQGKLLKSTDQMKPLIQPGKITQIKRSNETTYSAAEPPGTFLGDLRQHRSLNRACAVGYLCG